MKNIAALLFSKPYKGYAILFFYHLLFIVLAYQLRVSRTVSDAHLYWGKTLDFNQYSWFDFANYGAKFMVFINYPLVQLGFPFWSGFLLYGIIGFFGILKWMQWTDLVLKDRFVYKGFDLMYLLFFMPNLHVWTSSIGKEALVFWGIASVVFGLTTQRYKSVGFIVGSLVVLIIRPHVALMLLAAISLGLLFEKKISLKKRITIAGISFIGVLVLLYFVLQITNINYWDWKRINYFNEYSILSFRHSGSYVPMLDYNYGYRWFSFHFRPLFFDADTGIKYVASLENLLTLLIFIAALFLALKFYRKIQYTLEMKTVFLFTFIASALYIERYANLGIFMRTKIMFHPFLIVSLLIVIHQGISVMKAKINEKT
ncbi:hypothetical protein HKT18_10080 [Flavobacterium sp. IMCC34852]|uniref:Glycosyltransferase RgtA/B/C/D-like domain-containing protein n=1 Tax=Flavobacterium rivulicola TaxID=2732161 RepID=A0A7Y3R9T0_9FLAO|nr:hypothetical protein [Flavobacterium sp. IMCC34852]NNT72564.1 hypothetical protein [Flavobacterium sp. IMCC34852]